MAKKPVREQTEFNRYFDSLCEHDKNLITSFFFDFDTHCTLDRRAKDSMRRDFENAILYFFSVNTPLQTALDRLSIKNLGSFYSRPPVLWFPLDNAAKMYPLAMKQSQMALFRLSMRLTSDVIPEILQTALTFTIKRFPSFATTVKKGFFWHYLDTSKRRYEIQPETVVPCKLMDISASRSQSFRVLYFNNRISVEFFHVLTDGYGSMAFIKALTVEYFRLLGTTVKECDGIFDINAHPQPDEFINEFARVEKTEDSSGFLDKQAVQMSGRLSKKRPCRVLHFKMDASQLKQTAKRKNTSITAYILAVMFIAIKQATDRFKGNVSIQLPVNMRKYYPSKTLLNFSMYCGIKFPLEEITNVENMVDGISAQIDEKTSKERMSMMISSTKRMVGALRYVPLFIKTPLVRILYDFMGDRIFSSTMSNLGVVSMPQELDGYIESMDAILGSSNKNRATCSMITFGNVATLSVSKMTSDPTFEEKLYSLLVEDGITTFVDGSGLYEN